MVFALERFVDECTAALGTAQPQPVIRELVAACVADPRSLLAVLGTPERAGIQPLHVTGRLAILNVVWGPGMTAMPHNHNTWAAIRVYGGREDNIFWRRRAADAGSTLEAAGAQSLGAREATSLGATIIHSVTNPTSQLTGALHVYGGDFFTIERSEWDPLDLVERPYSAERSRERFERANVHGGNGSHT